MTNSKVNFFEVERAGINTTFQDNGRKNFYHIGIPFSGAMDNRNFVIANALSNNKNFEKRSQITKDANLLKSNWAEGKKIIVKLLEDM
mgnify:CR=1 FL=1